MSDGVAVSSDLPRRLGAAGLSEWVTTVPLRLLRDFRPLAVEHLKTGLRDTGLPAVETTLILVLDGEPSDARGAQVAQRFAQVITASRLFKEVQCRFLRVPDAHLAIHDQKGRSLVVPFMPLPSEHGDEAIRKALTRWGVRAPVTEPAGIWPKVPDMVARTVNAHAMNLAP